MRSGRPAYWAARLRQEPSNEFAKSQKDVSDRLQAKLAKAFEKLEARSVALRRFYNECDARLAAMERRNRDLEEFRRLEELSGRADMVIAEAEGTISGLATAFVAEGAGVRRCAGRRRHREHHGSRGGSSAGQHRLFRRPNHRGLRPGPRSDRGSGASTRTMSCARRSSHVRAGASGDRRSRPLRRHRLVLRSQVEVNHFRLSHYP